MKIEIADYSAYLGLPMLAPEIIEQIQQIAHEVLGGMTININERHLEFDYSGRDTGRKIIHFLCRIAPLIGKAEGEVECRLTTDTDKTYLEFYTIEHFRLYRQRGKIIKMHKTEVCLEMQAPGLALSH